MPGVGVRLLAVAAVIAFLGAVGSARAADPTLTADVGADDSFAITLKDPSSASISHVDAGTYTLVIHDHSSFHDFHLSGPGVDVTSAIDEIGDKTFTITLVDGTYFFQCDPHSSQMHGSFTVGSVTAPPPPPPKPAPTKLAAAIGPGAKVSLKPATGLSAGTFKIQVSDRSASDGFRLAGPGIARATGAKFRGTVTWTVTLKAGKYSYGSAKLRRSFTVSS
jgi:plastocyanin